jgi:hypothetical protein
MYGFSLKVSNGLPYKQASEAVVSNVEKFQPAEITSQIPRAALWHLLLQIFGQN